jgi:hypothetical protein
MSVFTDRVMVNLSDPARLRELVVPATDTSHQRLRQLFARVYSLPSGVLHSVLEVAVSGIEFQRPLFPAMRTSGTWTRTQPAHSRTDIRHDGIDLRAPQWLDVSATVALTVVLRLDPGEIESVRHSETEDHLVTEVKLAPPPEFDPADPANQRLLELRIAVFIRDTIDLVEALRVARRTAEIADRVLPAGNSTAETEITAPHAPVLAFPAAAVPATGMTEVELSRFLDAAGVLGIFLTP